MSSSCGRCGLDRRRRRDEADRGSLLIERVVTLGSAGVDRGHRREADRGSLLIERVVILGLVALWIERTSVRLIEYVVILWPVRFRSKASAW
jgi:hypothetical protein